MQRLLLLMALMVLANGVTSSARRPEQTLPPGGFEHEELLPDEECRTHASEVRSQLQSKYPAKVHSVEPIGCKCVLVAGFRCHIRALVVEQPSGESCDLSTRYIFMMTYRTFHRPIELVSLKLDFGLDESLFDNLRPAPRLRSPACA